MGAPGGGRGRRGGLGRCCYRALVPHFRAGSGYRVGPGPRARAGGLVVVEAGGVVDGEDVREL